MTPTQSLPQRMLMEFCLLGHMLNDIRAVKVKVKVSSARWLRGDRCLGRLGCLQSKVFFSRVYSEASEPPESREPEVRRARVLRPLKALIST